MSLMHDVGQAGHHIGQAAGFTYDAAKHSLDYIVENRTAGPIAVVAAAASPLIAAALSNGSRRVGKILGTVGSSIRRSLEANKAAPVVGKALYQHGISPVWHALAAVGRADYPVIRKGLVSGTRTLGSLSHMALASTKRGAAWLSKPATLHGEAPPSGPPFHGMGARH